MKLNQLKLFCIFLSIILVGGTIYNIISRLPETCSEVQGYSEEEIKNKIKLGCELNQIDRHKLAVYVHKKEIIDESSNY